MNIEGGVDELERTANYRVLCKMLRPAGIGSVVFGLIALATGMASLSESSANAILAAIGCFLLVEGMWIIAAPRPLGMITNGLSLIGVGGWNIYVTFANVASGAGTGTVFATLGIWQIIWGVQSIRRFTRFPRDSGKVPSDEALKLVDDLVKSVANASPDLNSNIVSFSVPGYPSKKIWKGKLTPEWALFVEGSGRDIVFAKPEGVNFTERRKAYIGKAVKASFQIGSRSLKGSLYPDSLTKYQLWKHSV